MADQGRDGYLGKAKVVGYAREAVTEDMRRDIGEWGILEYLLPMIRKAAERIVLVLPWEDK